MAEARAFQRSTRQVADGTREVCQDRSRSVACGTTERCHVEKQGNGFAKEVCNGAWHGRWMAPS